MRVTIRDESVLNSVSPLTLEQYLLAHGWRQGKRFATAWVWHLDRHGEPYEVLVPGSQDVSGYSRAVADILYNLEIIEERSQIELLDDIKHTNQDTIRIRSEAAGDDSGTVPIDEGAGMISGIRESLLASAVVSQFGRRNFSYIPVDASQYIESVRMGQTEWGSYIFRVHSPVIWRRSEAQRTMNLETGPSYPRRAVETLMKAVYAADHTATSVMMSGRMEEFDSVIENGVNAKLCMALADMQEAVGGSAIALRVSWSPLMTTSDQSLSSVRLSAYKHEVLRAAGDYFRKQEETEGVLVQGMVELLSRPQSKQLGLIKLTDREIGGRRHVYHVELMPDEYATATRAHVERLPLEIEGDMVRESGKSVIRNPGRVRILSPDGAQS